MLEIELVVNRAALTALLEGHQLMLRVEDTDITLRVTDDVVKEYQQHLQLTLLHRVPVGGLPH